MLLQRLGSFKVICKKTGNDFKRGFVPQIELFCVAIKEAGTCVMLLLLCLVQNE